MPARGASDSDRHRSDGVRSPHPNTHGRPTHSRTEDTADTGGLDARKAAILNAVVTEYIGSAQPVGSQHVVDAPGVSVSSATVRSDMAALERDGFLAQPHTSAGRIPTDKGYRFFVDHLAGTGSLDPNGRQQVRQFFNHAHGEIEMMLERTSGLLADLTDCTAMVVGPSHESAAIRSVQLVGLGPRLALLVVVLADGAVQKQSVEFADDVDDAVLSAAAARLAAHSLGVPLTQVGPHRLDHRRSDHRCRGRVGTGRPAVARERRRGGTALRRRLLPDGRRLRRGGDGAFGAEHPRAAAGGGHPARATSSTPGCRWPSAPSTAWSRWPRAPSW